MLRIPPANLRSCLYCGCDVDTSRHGNYQRGRAWFKKQKGTSGTNSAALVKWIDEYACAECIAKVLAGIPVGQMRLYDDA